MNKKIQLIAFILFCIMLVAFSLHNGQASYGKCNECNFFYHYR